MILNLRKNLIRTIILAAVLTSVCIVVFFAARSSPEQNHRTLFTQFVISGGSIVWFILLPLSVITVGLTIDYFMNIKASILLPPNSGAEIIRIIRDKDRQKLIEILTEKKDFVSTAVLAAVRNQSADRRQIEIQLQIQNTIADALKQQCRVLLRKIEWLNIIGNVSPMIGLFGTVYGMIKLFNSIVLAGGQPRPEQMADGISIALVTTFWGLLIAIPALVVHSIFSNRIESIAQQAAIQAEMVLIEIKNSIENQPFSKPAEKLDEN
jgi:biopolymer transport protein ExbB